MEIKIFSLFPEMFEGPLGSSLIGKAQEKDILHIDVINFREYSTNKHKSVDDYPFGGGAGMVLQPEPIVSALRDNLDLDDPDTEVILMSPQGKPFTQEAACALAQKKQLAFV
ncbi:MAG: tRNA (guanosine(37)-N1)-methyltransferase TrmD, partial [Peptococcaceae bacterium]|nr:tRNA (guanosine(37)-N1)-methyltransferase TrmD [Peptococcaceae bacterium]